MKKVFEKDMEDDLQEVISRQLVKINYGTLSIVVQDNKVLQMNIDESYDFNEEEKKLNEKEKNSVVDYKRVGEKNITDEIIGQIIKVINSIQYGHLAVNVKNGKIIQYEKTEKFRVR